MSNLEICHCTRVSNDTRALCTRLNMHQLFIFYLYSAEKYNKSFSVSAEE